MQNHKSFVTKENGENFVTCVLNAPPDLGQSEYENNNYVKKVKELIQIVPLDKTSTFHIYHKPTCKSTDKGRPTCDCDVKVMLKTTEEVPKKISGAVVVNQIHYKNGKIIAQ